MTTRLSGIALAGLIAALGATACGSSDTKAKASPTKEGTKVVEGQVLCGPTVCKPKEGFTGTLCCKSNFEGTCGQMVAGSCTDLAPDADERCESAMIMGGGGPMMVPSCCTMNNECGLSFFAAMCTSLTQVRQFGRMGMMPMGTAGMGGGMFSLAGLPEPKTCDGDPIEAPAAGAAGSGM